MIKKTVRAEPVEASACLGAGPSAINTVFERPAKGEVPSRVVLDFAG